MADEIGTWEANTLEGIDELASTAQEVMVNLLLPEHIEAIVKTMNSVYVMAGYDSVILAAIMLDVAKERLLLRIGQAHGENAAIKRRVKKLTKKAKQLVEANFLPPKPASSDYGSTMTAANFMALFGILAWVKESYIAFVNAKQTGELLEIVERERNGQDS